MGKVYPELKGLSPLVLAYIGDGIYELMVRNYLLHKGFINLKLLHRETVATVNAVSQSKLFNYLDEILTEEEREILRRGRNAKSGHTPKGADVLQYRHATGLEAVFGYLYLNQEHSRIEELFYRIMTRTEIMKEKEE